MNEQMRKFVPRLMVVITDSGREQKVSEILQGAHVQLHYQCHGEGTASNEILDLLGLGSVGKAITICLAPRLVVKELLMQVRQKLRLDKPGKGIAFTLPVSGASSPIMRLMDSEIREKVMNQMESDVENMAENAAFSLIVATVNQGYSDELMAAAKQAGATGGTVIHARRLGLEEPMKRWGITLQAEKEIITILAPKELKADIMRAISHKYGFGTEAQGMVLSLPVESVAGLDERPRAVQPD